MPKVFGDIAMSDNGVWREFIAEKNSGRRVEISREIYDYYLGILPPATRGVAYELDGEKIISDFGFAEGRERIVAFWEDAGKLYCQRTKCLNI